MPSEADQEPQFSCSTSYKRFHTMDSIKYALTEGFPLSQGFAFQRKKNVTAPQKNLPLLNALQNHALRFPLFVCIYFGSLGK